MCRWIVDGDNTGITVPEIRTREVRRVLTAVPSLELPPSPEGYRLRRVTQTRLNA